ncbi:hypothetical protein I6A60_20350 [Frankia sp. AgB1.9]|uniref:hypothetical protein n=1 Tax=unclassified Frankia TaxID=2632575 RepID=UPI00193167D0|nr:MULTISPECIES: hypothetical protein [unclassified Frankia]MBL7491924.1 hypothetical protein [Frankia sp. AgW1.1]MBL7550213.1 hypothetical protein [Frankia sp. AgB1.9]MBL7619872.1 hypothetical protein [Frankia sp. AgB1.8]
MNPHRVLVRVLAVALCAALAALAGQTAGVLAYAGGADLVAAFLTGGAAFVLVLPVTLTVAEKLGVL